MSILSVQYGGAGSVVKNTQGIKFVRGGVVIDNTTEVFEFEPSGIYIFICVQWTASSGARQGRQISLICAPEDELFGTVASTREAMATGGTARVTYTLNSDSSLSVTQTSSAYNWRYVLYRVDGTAGGSTQQQSDIPIYSGAYSVDPNFEIQTLATANKRMTADVDVAAIPVTYEDNASGGKTVTIGTV